MPKICGLLASVILITIVIAPSHADRQTFDSTLAWVAMPLPEAPGIDGVIEPEVWQWAGGSQAGGNSSDWFIEFNLNALDFVLGGENPTTRTGGPLSAEDIRIEIFAGYTQDNLYVAVRVQDDLLLTDTAEAGSQNQQTWMDDSVEVFVDGDNSNFPDRDATGENPEVVDTGGQFVITANNAFREAEAGNPGFGPDQAWHAVTQINDDQSGYEAEFRISMDALGNPQQGDIIGFTVAVNDDDGGDPAPDNQYTWIGAPHTEVSYGNLVLGPRTYTAPKVSIAPVQDGEIGTGEYSEAERVEVDTHTGMYVVGDNDWPEDDHAFTFQVVHDDEYVYIGMTVMDDQIKTDSAEGGSENQQTWRDDSGEVFIDGDNSDDLIRFQDAQHGPDEFEGQYVFTANGARRSNEANNPPFGEDAQWVAAHSTSDTGFVAEFKIGKEGLLIAPDAEVIGFNININDDDDNVFGREPKIQLDWGGRPHLESSYSDLILAANDTSVVNWNLF